MGGSSTHQVGVLLDLDLLRCGVVGGREAGGRVRQNRRARADGGLRVRVQVRGLR